MLVSAPTSSGKTVIADYCNFRARHEGNKVIYTTPLKALSNQKFHDFRREFGDEHVGLVTGENTINDEASIVVMTTEILRTSTRSATWYSTRCTTSTTSRAVRSGKR